MAVRGGGRLKIFMGYAAGVGKTYQMLEAAHDLKSKGSDVVIGYFEPHNRKDTIAKTEGLEMIARKKISYRGTVFEEMDTEAILARQPQVAVVDEFPHSNVPGSGRALRSSSRPNAKPVPPSRSGDGPGRPRRSSFSQSCCCSRGNRPRNRRAGTS